jgi:DNA processing protein
MNAAAPADDPVARLALAHLPQLGPLRARWLLGADAGPVEVWAALQRGALPVGLGRPPSPIPAGVVTTWTEAARRIDPVERWEAHQAAGLRILTPGHPDWPFEPDPQPPVMVWALGRPELLRSPATVAVVGSRRCTAVGARVATAMGRTLADAGVTVVSGLASGIDAAAHRGALDAGGSVVGVVATGPDVVFPRSSADLWRQVPAVGVLVGESPLGTPGRRWRFPARNRIIAALSRIVVVVESHARGGALHTVAEAERRQVPVLAVPGSVLSRASAGTNQLLADGVGVARDAVDVLVALGLETVPRLPFPEPDRSPAPDPATARILEELAAGPLDPARLLPDRPLDEVLVAVQRLVTQGRVEVRGGMVTLTTPGSGDTR